jgi:hypothetical protein
VSNGVLRSLVVYPDRTPEVETCLRLARATRIPAAELFRLAKLPYGDDPQAETIDPERADLLQAYEHLEHPARRTLIDIARSLRTNSSREK